MDIRQYKIIISGWLIACTLGTVGCSSSAMFRKDVKRLDNVPDRYQTDARKIKSEPVHYLKELRRRCQTLEEYTLVFYRQERLGGTLKPMENMNAWYRKNPFSVKFEWKDPDADYYEAVYVQGENDNKLVVRERKGMLFFPPQIRKLNPQLTVAVKKSKNPITDFGLARLMERTLGPIEDLEIGPRITYEYKGVVSLDTTGQNVHHLRIHRPVSDTWTHARQDLFIDAETLLPAGTDLWLPNEQLDARYRYARIDTDVQLTDTDFRIREE